MNSFFRFVRVVARRDFLAVVGTPTFIIFLLGPLFMILLGILGGAGAASVANSSDKAARIAVIAAPADKAAIEAGDKKLRAAINRAAQPPALTIFAPDGDGAAQTNAIMGNTSTDYFVVMRGPLDHPTITHEAESKSNALWLAQVAEQVVLDRKAGLGVDARLSKPVMESVKAARPGVGLQQQVGYGAVFLIFLLTTILAGQAVGMLAEEKSNKVIEILAAAAPLESVFLGKLVGMLGIATLFVSFWALLLTLGVAFSPDATALVSSWSPAVGLPMFMLLCGAYFVMSYMLMGALLLGMGGLAATMRELQMMSLPVTLGQVGMYVLSSKAASNPGTTIAHVAEIIPFSSPMAMAAHASSDAALWPHALALGWQALWVAAVIWLMARLFRFGVLKSGNWKQFFGRKTQVI
jgi:ABC-2 type transport system permease protein